MEEPGAARSPSKAMACMSVVVMEGLLPFGSMDLPSAYGKLESAVV
jgi:hypothetical protein